jgi:hypothetical protein
LQAEGFHAGKPATFNRQLSTLEKTMSLLNDALKRAKESQRSDAPSGVSLLRPVEVRRKDRDFSRVLPVLIIFVIVVALFFIWEAVARHTANSMTQTIAAVPETTAPQPVAAIITTPAPNLPAAPNPTVAASPAQNPPAPVLSVVAPAPAASVPVAATAPAVVATPSTPSAPPVVAVISPPAVPLAPLPPTLIQGIAYDSGHPWAIINGRTVYVGEYVSGMRVTDISRHSVTLVGYGQTNNLVVGQQ